MLADVPGGQLVGDVGVEVDHLALDSRRARPGSCFFAATGASVDGARFVDDARSRGAVAVVAERSDALGQLPGLVVEDVRDALARAAAQLHRDLLEDLELVGVTGTKGKSTTVRMVAAALNAGGKPCASVGTLGVADREGQVEPLENTTPDPARLAEVLVDLAARGHRAVALEASSQAAVQARVRYLPFRSMAFLNLAPEHGELHPTMEEYREAKAQLFADAAAARPDLVVVIPAGSVDGDRMLAVSGPRATALRFGDGGDVQGRVIGGGLQSLDLELSLPGGERRLRLGFGGRFNLQNVLAAAALATSLGVGPDEVVAGIEGLPTLPGRFQVLTHGDVHAMVDYAHSADALAALLASCREVVGEGRLLLVFGCGGEKDPSKRPRMGASAAALADTIWVTNDNPRGEDPEAIAADVLAGMDADGRERARVELDRRLAIREALDAALPGDLVVIAGKGHETTQTVGGEVRPFDDRVEIERAWGLRGEG
jgi:UDP-N-acetylmuramoyl-L-alanyl-D-glutamate--2,6-diaminopimelate ligase